MNYNILSIPLFDKQFKNLARKYPLRNDLSILVDLLSNDPMQGKPLGNNFYKIRLAVTSKGRGKSGGARVITYIKIAHRTVYLTSIYDKSEKADISDSELVSIFKQL